MPTYRVGFNLAAIQDYLEAREWYAQRSEEVAARFLESVDAAIHRIRESPDSWPTVLGRYHRVSLETFPHSLIYYKRTDSDVRIVAVAHPSRRPGYWRRGI